MGACSLPALVLPVAVTSGLAFGACWTLLATLAADLFGVAHLAGNYTVLQVRMGRMDTGIRVHGCGCPSMLVTHFKLC